MFQEDALYLPQRLPVEDTPTIVGHHLHFKQTFKKTEQLQYSTQEHNSSFYNTTHNIKTIRQILHNIKIDLVLCQTL